MPTNLRQTHQSMHHFVADSPWNDERLLARVLNLVIPAIEKRMPISVWIIDDTGMPTQQRPTLRRCGASVLRAAREASELSGRRKSFGCKRTRKFAG